MGTPNQQTPGWLIGACPLLVGGSSLLEGHTFLFLGRVYQSGDTNFPRIHLDPFSWGGKKPYTNVQSHTLNTLLGKWVSGELPSDLFSCNRKKRTPSASKAIIPPVHMEPTFWGSCKTSLLLQGPSGCMATKARSSQPINPPSQRQEKKNTKQKHQPQRLEKAPKHQPQ